MADAKKRVLIFTKATDYVHECLPASAVFLSDTCRENGWESIVSADSSLLEGPNAPIFEVIVFTNNSGILFDTSKPGFAAHIAAGRGVLGIHGALATYLDGEDATGATSLQAHDPIIENIFGTHFSNHPPIQTARVSIHQNVIHDLKLSDMRKLPAEFQHTDEFYNYTSDVSLASHVHILATVDTTTYDAGNQGTCTKTDKPVVWARYVGPLQAPVFFCALGHFTRDYTSLGCEYIKHILRAGLQFASRSCSIPQLLSSRL